MENKVYSIKEVENLTGIKAHTIRIWEKRYRIVKPSRTDTRIRFYSDDELKRLLNVSILNKNGVKISKISKLNDEQVLSKVSEITNNIKDVDSQIETLVGSMLELDEIKFDKVISAALITFGFEESLYKILYPFYQRVNLLWQVGSINTAQEQFALNLIRKKLLVEIDSINPFTNPKGKTYLLFLPKGEFKEVELFFYKYIIKKRGHKALYLGQSVPIIDVIEVAKMHVPDFIFTYGPPLCSMEKFSEYVNILSEKFPEQKIYIGAVSVNSNVTLPKNVVIADSIADFRDELAKMALKP